MDDTQVFETFLDDRVIVLVGDITRERADAIVNAANSTLFGGGGVDGAIHRRGGPRILAACREIRRSRYPEGLPAGEAVITTGGNLPARYVIHTVGPRMGAHGGRESALLAACYRNSLALAVEHDLASVAFPSISTGAYGFPRADAAVVSSAAIRDFLRENETLKEVRLVFYQEEDAEIFLKRHAFGQNS